MANEISIFEPTSVKPAVLPTAGETGLIRAHGLAALATVGYSAVLGLIVAAKFVWPQWLASEAWLTWGRLRYAHTQGIFFGWLGNAFLLFLYYAVPRLANRPITSRRLGWGLFFVWNALLVIPGWILVQIGISQPLEWGEFPLVIDAVVVIAFILTGVQFAVPLLRAPLSELYVSGWYILGAIIFTLLAYPIGNFVPEFVPGARGATYSGLWIHDAIGLYVTPLALAIAFLVVPLTTGKPIYSHFLSMIGFWLLFFVYPLNGTHHYVFSSIPMDAQKGAIVASVYLGVDVVLVVTNLLLSLRGSSTIVARDVPLRFVWLGTVAYLVVSLQGSLQALMPVNRFVHFSDWVIGHSHLAMIGFASFTAIGGILHVWERTAGVHFNPRAANWSFWLLATGLAIMVADLTAAGLVQAELWQSDAAWMDSVRATGTFWLVRLISGAILLAGFLLLAVSMTTGSVLRIAVTDPATDHPSRSPAAEVAAGDSNLGFGWLRNAYVIIAVAGVGCFLFSFIVLAVWPNQILERQINESRPIDVSPLSKSEQRGRAIYAREGCMNCHSQLVRLTETDVRRFGPAGQAWEGERDYPQLWGTRRVGPDLSRERGQRTRDWQLAHLWNPRNVVPDSVMPPHPWLFDGSPSRPSQEGLDLAAYLDSLGRGATLAGLGEPALPGGLTPEQEQIRGMFCDCAISRTVGPAPTFHIGEQPGERGRAEVRGARVFAHHCAGCHGPKGQGNGPAAESLLPAPKDLTHVHFSEQAISRVLWFGVPGSSMPQFRDLSFTDLRGLVAYLQSFESGSDAAPAQAELASPGSQASELYRHNCVACHGVDGSGHSLAASTLAPPPTNFQQVQPSQLYAEGVLERGIPGTAMPRWNSKLTAAERRLLADYVRTLYSAPDTPSNRQRDGN